MAAKKAVKVVKKVTPVDEAKKLAPSTLLVPNIHARTIYQNVKFGLASLRASQSAIAAQLKSWDGSAVSRVSAINEELLSTSLAVIEAEPKTDNELAEDIAKAWGLRKLLLNQAEGATLAGVIPQSDLDAIVRGRGLGDCAADLVALSKLLRKHAEALGKKTLITAEHLDAALALGQSLPRKIKTKKAKLTPQELVRARELRNRLYTLLKQAHDELWGVAALVFGRQLLAANFPDLNAEIAEKPPKSKPAELKAAADSESAITANDGAAEE